MGNEIERKFLVNGNQWREGSKPVHICQGYLLCEPNRTIRIRLMGEQAFLTVKGRAEGILRPEYEYEIPLADAKELLGLCLQPYVEKNRYNVMHAGMKWEIDEFLMENLGLMVAEIELPSADQQFDLPAWVGAEVSDDPRYSNANLVKHPFSKWKHQQ